MDQDEYSRIGLKYGAEEVKMTEDERVNRTGLVEIPR
jgi:hypothetical protein